MRFLKIAFICVSISTLAGCNLLNSSTSSTSPDLLNDCNASATETYFDDNTSQALAPGDEAAQQIQPGGDVGASLALNQVVIHMGTQGVSTVTLAVYEGGSYTDPTSGQVIASTTLSSGLGNSSLSAPVTFNFSPAPSLQVGGQYFLVLSGTGGTIELSTSSVQTLPDFLMTYTGGSWNGPWTGDMSISFS